MQQGKLKCPNCGFKAKSEGGLRLHIVNKMECREAVGKNFIKKSAKKAKKGAGKPPQRSPEPGYEEGVVDEIDILREIFENEGIKTGIENIINSLKRGDIYDLYDLNELMRERGITAYKRRGVIRAWADASELDIPEDLLRDLRMRGRHSRDYGVTRLGEARTGMKRARRADELRERLRERKYERLEDLGVKREIKEEQKELEAMEKGKERGKEKKSMMLVPLQQKDGSVTYQPVNVPKDYAALSPMINPFMMNPMQSQRSRGDEELRKRFEKLESMMEKMKEDREHKAIRDDVHRLTERLEQMSTEDKGGAWREELRELRTKLDDERFNTLRGAIAGKLRELDERTRHGELDMYSKVGEKLEDLGVSGGKKTREDHEMEIERTDHKKRMNMLENQFRGIHRRVDDVVDVVKPAAKLLVMERVREEGKRKGKKSLQKKYTAKELEAMEKALKEEDKGAKKSTAPKRKKGRKGKGKPKGV